jgi:hypothetical protein
LKLGPETHMGANRQISAYSCPEVQSAPKGWHRVANVAPKHIRNIWKVSEETIDERGSKGREKMVLRRW